ncbi:MAG: glycosyltransferase family 4 protein, partial [Verrucomicrobiota bacterium]
MLRHRSHAVVPTLLAHIRHNTCNPMVGETLNAPPLPRTAPAAPRVLPRHMLYSIFARIGGSGLDTDAFETLRASHRGGFLGKAVAYDNRQLEIPSSLIHSLRWHPVRLISFLDRPYYYGAKKKYLDWIASRQLATGRYDLFHSWSGDCLQSLRVARKLGIPSLVEIPTWHRDRGRAQRQESKAETAAPLPFYRRWKEDLLLQRTRYIEEYELANLLVVLSSKAAETFRIQGFPEEKLFYLPRGVDVERFKPGPRPPIFRAVFSGALIERKGIHHLLEAWHRLNLKDAELWLVGSVHKEAKPHLKKFWRDNITVVGFTDDVAKYLSQSTVHIFPSQLEGSAKVTYEAAACGLPQITTREAGDVVNDGLEGIIVPPADLDALADAIMHLYQHPEIVERMGIAARERVVNHFTWDHFRTR